MHSIYSRAEIMKTKLISVPRSTQYKMGTRKNPRKVRAARMMLITPNTGCRLVHKNMGSSTIFPINLKAWKGSLTILPSHSACWATWWALLKGGSGLIQCKGRTLVAPYVCLYQIILFVQGNKRADSLAGLATISEGQQLDYADIIDNHKNFRRVEDCGRHESH